jgi:dihydrofolate reductase
MFVTLMMVSSVDGKITNGDDSNIYSWTSAEDSALFSSLIEKHNLIVMGRTTYEAAKENIQLKEGKLRIVLTHNPSRYTKYARPGQLEFSDESPKELVQRLEQAGYKEMLLVGGGEINAAFFEAGLIDEFHLTIEPVVFGKGKPLVAEVLSAVSLTLVESKNLNDRGTLYLRYLVHKAKL